MRNMFISISLGAIAVTLLGFSSFVMSEHHGHAKKSPLVSDRNVPVALGARREVLVDGLENPWGLAFLPDGTMLVTERPGRLRIVRDGQLLDKPVAGVPAVFSENQGGLLDITVHPKFSQNSFIYFSYSHGTAEANRTRLARARFADDRLTDLKVIFEVSQLKPRGQHFGSRLAWMDDGTLLMSIGDGGNPPTSLNGRHIRDYAQALDSHFGKLLRLNDDGSVPDDNPFVSRDGVKPEIYSYGHRNIQGVAFDPVRKTVWTNEHGALGGDELNRISAGANYGWPLVSHSREYRGGDPVGKSTSAPGKKDPLLVWEVAIAPSGLMLYNGDAFPQWRGDLFSSALMSQDIRRVELDKAGRIIGESALRIGQRVRHVTQGPDGLIYVLTDESHGKLLRMVPRENSEAAPQSLKGKKST